MENGYITSWKLQKQSVTGIMLRLAILRTELK